MAEVLPEISFTDRLSELVSSFGSAEKLARASGISSRVIGKYLKGESKPGLDSLVAMAKAAGFKVEWLATGEGPKKREEVGEQERYYRLDQEEFVLVPRYDVQASAGGGAVIHSEQVVDHLAFKRSWLKSLSLDPKRLALITAKGDSMSPVISDGDLLLVDTRDHEQLSDGVYVVRLEGLLLAKYLQRDPLEKGIIIKSANPAYSELRARPDQIQLLDIVGRVVWAGGKM